MNCLLFHFHKISYVTRGEERQGADTENSERSVATTPANYIDIVKGLNPGDIDIDIVYFKENSLKIIQNFTENGVGAVHLANP